MANVIYRGPAAREPQTVNDCTVAGAYNPGILVTSDGSALTVATASDQDERLYVLGNARYAGQDVATAYTSGDTGVAYVPEPGQRYQCRMAAATYAVGDALMVGASGYLEAATTGKPIFAFYEGTAGAVSAGALADVRIGDGVAKA